MEKLFKIKERGSSVSKEVIAGITTFFAMAYIIFVNPDYLSQAGMDRTAVMVATCASAAIGTILTAFLANVPFAQAPGMGLNAFFTYTICFGMGYTWQQGLTIVLISGLIFLLITLTPLRSKLIGAIPACLKSAISAGIGMFIAFIGLINAQIVIGFGEGVGVYTELGSITSGTPLLTLIGLLITGALLVWKVKGAMIIGIIATTLIGIPMGITVIGDISFSSVSLAPTFLQLDFNLLTAGVLPLVTAVLTFALVDCFDTIGTLVGTAQNVGMIDEKGELPGGDKALIADALATCVGACLGTSTVTTFVESSTGIEAGGRTGLASVVTGALFALCIFLAPIAGIVPSAATAPALIIVGVYMLKGAAGIDWHNMEEAIPCFLTIAMMPFAYSIADGIGFGFISYAFLKLVRGKGKEVPVLVYIISLVFIAMYILNNIPQG